MSSAKQKPFSPGQCVKNNNVAHSSHNVLNINDGGLWQFAESVSVVCYEYLAMTSPSSMLVPDHCVCKGQHSTFDDS